MRELRRLYRSVVPVRLDSRLVLLGGGLGKPTTQVIEVRATKKITVIVSEGKDLAIKENTTRKGRYERTNRRSGSRSCASAACRA